MARATLKLKRPITDIEIDIDENSLYTLGYKKIKEFETENNYIEKEDAITAVGEAIADGKPWFDALLNIPTVDVVSASAYRQVTWERDTTISQLQEIGKGLGENMNDVAKQRKGKWVLNKNMIYAKKMEKNIGNVLCVVVVVTVMIQHIIQIFVQTVEQG